MRPPIAIALALILFAHTASGQEAVVPGAALPAAAAGVETAPVTVDGEVLFRLRGNSSYLATQRARDVADAIEAVARDTSMPASEVRVADAGDRANILAGDQVLVSVFDGDALAESMNSRHRLAENHRNAIERAITRQRHDRSPEYLRTRAVHAAIAITIAALLVLRWAFDWVVRSAEARFQRRLEELEARSYQVISAEQVRTTVESAVRAVRWLFRLS